MVINLFKKYLKVVLVIIVICITYTCTHNPSNSLIFPIKCNYVLTSGYGFRSFDNSFHNGIDCAASEGTPIYAMSNGIVTYSGFNSSGGNMLIIQYDNGYRSMYCHMDNNILVNKGERVKSGEQVGCIGPKYISYGKLNGDTTGVHLHFSLFFNDKSVNPLEQKYT